MFIRPPGHCLNQFREGIKCYNSKRLETNISVRNPGGVFEGSDKDISNGIISFIFRNNTSKWFPKFRHIQKNNGKWIVQSRLIKKGEKTLVANKNSYANIFNDIDIYKKNIIVSDSANVNTGNALGFYYPNSEIYKYCVVGATDTNELIIYKDARTITVTTVDDPIVARPPFSAYGFRTKIKGIINKHRLKPGTHETFRSEYYVLYGTPKEIMDAVKVLEKNVVI